MSNPSQIIRTVVIVAVLLTVTAIATQAGTPVRLTDVTGPGTLPSNANAFVASGGFVYFRAQDPDHGSEIWRTDGTTVGTVRLTDALPGPVPPQGEPSELSPIAAVGTTVFFLGWDAAHGWELWKTDSSPTGARLVSDVVPGPMDGYPRWLAATPSRVFFVANGRFTGTELFVSDASEGGAVPVASGLQNPVRIVAMGERAFVLNYASGKEIWWVSDSTPAGTGPFENLSAPEPWTMRGETTAFAGGFIYFTSCSAASGCEVWRSDGTVAGTTRFTDLVTPGSGYQPPTVQVAGVTSTTLFVDVWPNGPNGGGGELWAIDLTTQVATKLANSPLYLRDTMSVGNVLYYRAPHSPATGWELGRSDGTPAGTQVLDLVPGPESSYVYPIGQAGGRLFLRGETNVYVNGQYTEESWLWSSDGTFEGSVRILALVPSMLEPGGNLGGGIELNGKYVFGASELTARTGIEPWVSDGTVAGTRSLGDLNADPRGADPAEMTANGSRVAFRGCDPEHGCEVWSSDGTPGGTALAADVTAGPSSSYPLDFTAFDNAVYLRCDRGRHLCRFDGTSIEHIQLENPELIEPYYLMVAGDSLYFTAADYSPYLPYRGRELWRIGASGPPALVKDIYLGSSSSSPYNLTPVGDSLYFVALGGALGEAIWKTDGTESGTTPLKTTYSDYWNPYSMAPLGTDMYFRAGNQSFGAELWKTDGTASGTGLFKDINETPSGQDPNRTESSAPFKLTSAGDRLYFTAYTQDSGRELWTSDGAAEGTYLVKDIIDESDFYSTYEGFGKVHFPEMVPMGTRLFFTTWEPATGVELWQSDATAAGTNVVRDIADNGDAHPASLVPYRGTLFFSAWDPEHGRELWQTDGGEDSTLVVADLAQGDSSSSPTELSVIGGQLLFSARDGVAGRELWRMPLPDVVLPALSVTEGGSATLTPITVDPDGTGLSFSWDLDGDGTWDQGTSGPTATFSAAGLDGPSAAPIGVRVADVTGVMAIDRGSVAILNVAPVVDVGSAAAIEPGQVLERVGTFTDPGPDSWTATVDYGDGSGPSPLLLSGTTFALTHLYPEAGDFAVIVTITDDDGGVGTAALAVTVLTPQGRIGSLIDDVEELLDDGTLKLGQGKSLIGKLELALYMLKWGNTTKAITMLEAFIQEVEAFLRAGILTPEQGDPLIAKAQAAIASLG